jgi:CTD kinase subunit beta
VIETILDLLDLYTNHRTSTIIGQRHALETFIDIRITMNQEASRKDLPRFTRPLPRSFNGTRTTNGAKGGPSTDTKPMDPATPNGTTGRASERGRDGTVRFMLSHDRAEREKKIVAAFFEDEEEEYEVEVERPARRGEV